MDQRLKDVHIRGGSLNPESFSAEERQFLGKHLGKKKVPEFEGPGASVGFAMEWTEGADSDEIARLKVMMVPSAPPADEGKWGGNSAPAPKPKKKKPKKK